MVSLQMNIAICAIELKRIYLDLLFNHYYQLSRSQSARSLELYFSFNNLSVRDRGVIYSEFRGSSVRLYFF